MKINGNESENYILEIIGKRIKAQRISMQMTQWEMSEKTGVSASTIERIENGADTKLSNIIKLMKGLGIAYNLNIVIPEEDVDFKRLYEKRPQPQRARKKREKSSEWVWGEDRKEV